MPKNRDAARASLENLYRIFTVPEAPDSTLGAIDQAISGDVAGFLQTHIVAIERPLEEIEADFSSFSIPEEPTYVSEYTEFVKENLVAHSVHTASPAFVGHMTSALPYFMLPLARLMTALNQNVVKVETSKAFTPMERQVLAMLHHLVYGRDDGFYPQWIHNSQHALGAFCSGGTIANVTALWVARNRLFAPDGGFRGIAQEGLARALKYRGVDGIAVLVSERGHYSLGKAADLLGIGRDDLIKVKTDANNRIDLKALREECRRLQDRNTLPLALVGIAGTTETGNVDPLEELADLAQELGCHFHVDAAWGGPTLFSDRHRHLLSGIERADSVTIDGHKQLYVPMGAGMVVFKDPTALSAIEHHANYILRHGSKDLGSHTLEGSRPGKAMLVHAGFSIIGRKGYELLIDMGIERARTFADMIQRHPDFELISEPELNILTYRYCPPAIQQALTEATAQQRAAINGLLDQVCQLLQKYQREAGKTFVSRTRLHVARHDMELTVLRVVLANPLTTDEILEAVLAEQCEIVRLPEIQALLRQAGELCPGLAKAV
ncbi:putative pyridoxal-dependent aspartate 1-decarboxylase [Geobacter hydrogenophilus]|uniref:2,4-diaminobutyrate decarboxylase n=1 Tax=Geobacter hydrogenophilus TaxID=40983 RepID=A0A9W6LCJ9_9BACT|nr:putative pyridoxal-dependent aspartate 1-decarboxylase [Geobacter hydrogenophilus]MBT0893260.1 putative pyridoxal-dependent aspartate 1-decarboxylase [Geobacter hydrogenophilus]GLI38893.1 2,4-diaminobutyrate decarboxylase [Geobacter hydrogenophilus]